MHQSFTCGVGIVLNIQLFALLYSFFGRVHVVNQERQNDEEEGEEETSASNLQTLRTTASKLFQLNQAIRQLHSSLSTTLQGDGPDTHSLNVMSYIVVGITNCHHPSR